MRGWLGGCRYQQYIGKVTSAAFLTGGQRKRVYVATESGAVAALNLRKGDIGETLGRPWLRHPGSALGSHLLVQWSPAAGTGYDTVPTVLDWASFCHSI